LCLAMLDHNAFPGTYITRLWLTFESREGVDACDQLAGLIAVQKCGLIYAYHVHHLKSSTQTLDAVAHLCGSYWVLCTCF
jgi:hypothetical protein